MAFEYEKDPQAIEQASFAQLRALVQLDGLAPAEQQVVMRIVHSIGLPDVAPEVRFSEDACESGIAALEAAAPILCDADMVAQGLTKRLLPVQPQCLIAEPETAELARRLQVTRSMAAVERWAPQLAGSIVIVGNAPTALFRLLELIEEGAGVPALVIGMPVGFIGAAESKQALWEHHRALGIPCITLLGRLGGSAVAAASLNALMRYRDGECY